MGALLYHAGDDLSMCFVVYQMIMKKTNLRDVFTLTLSGYNYHMEQLQKYQQIVDHELKEKMDKNSVDLSMYGSDWVFTLFTPYIPLDQVVS